MGHYFTNNENLKSELRSINYNLLNTSFVFFTDNGVFSKSSIDFGSKLLIEEYLKNSNNNLEILDVGCGYGVIGITLSKLTNSYVEMIDINKRSVHLTKMNIDKNKVNANTFVSDIYENITKKYDIIITNPPIRAGKKVYMTILNDAKNHLKENGELWFVIRKEQGAKTVAEKLEEIYNITLIEKYKGYYIYCANLR